MKWKLIRFISNKDQLSLQKSDGVLDEYRSKKKKKKREENEL